MDGLEGGGDGLAGGNQLGKYGAGTVSAACDGDDVGGSGKDAEREAGAELVELALG